MRIRFSLKITLICGMLILGMLRASYWQWERHLQKKELIQVLNQRLLEPVGSATELAGTAATDWNSLLHRRLKISGEFDYSREVVVKNRRLGEVPGMFVLTPLKISGSDIYILVNRGFLPMGHTSQAERRKFQKSVQAEFYGLVKAGMQPKFYSPADAPAGAGNPWVDEWLRIDLEHMQKQLPYPLLPVYVETIPDDKLEIDPTKIVRTDSEREDMLFMPLRMSTLGKQQEVSAEKYPVPVYDAVIPPGRHLGYVYEWAFMALMTGLIGLVLQLRRPGK